MARFDVHANPDDSGWLLDVQSDLLDGLTTRVVVPLLPIDMAPKPARRLNPIFTIEDRQAVMVTQFLAAVPASILPPPRASLALHQNDITAALDMLFQGF